MWLRRPSWLRLPAVSGDDRVASLNTRPTTNSTTMRRTAVRNSPIPIVSPGAFAFFTMGCLLYASERRPRRRPHKIGSVNVSIPEIPEFLTDVVRISSNTLLSHPGRESAGRFLHTSHTDEASAADEIARILLVCSV